MFTLTLHPLLYCHPASYSLLDLSLFVSSSFPSDPPGWLVCCCATSAHSLQEMTDADEGRKTPLLCIKDYYVPE